MSQQGKTAKEKAQALEKGIRRLGRNRVVAMPVHTTLDLIDELEALAAELAKQLPDS